MLIGRIAEQETLREALRKDQSQFIAIYGRRRVGKTFLVRETFNYKFTFQHTGLAKGKTSEQLMNFQESLKEYGYSDAPLPQTWLEAFSLLKQLIKNSRVRKKVIFIDELPWLDTPKSSFLSALEHFWNGWATSRKDVVLIVCGSATSWIIRKIVNNHGGLHNRITDKILLEPFTLAECESYSQSLGLVMSREQILESYMILGGIPYYWSLLSAKKSLSQNIDALFFASNGKLTDEFDHLYASLFKKKAPYIDIVSALSKKRGGMTREELIQLLKVNAGGQLSQRLKELEQCGFIRKYCTPGKKVKDAIYQLIDNYTIFYFIFIQNNTGGDERFWTSSIDAQFHRVWEGLAFERVVLQHIIQVKKALEIGGVLTNVYSWRYQGEEGAQVDLVIDRRDDVINLCEIKFSGGEYLIDKAYSKELKQKRDVFREQTKTRKAVHLTMITTEGVKRNVYYNDIQSEVTLDQLFAN